MLSQSGEGHGYIFNEVPVVHTLCHTHTLSHTHREQAGVSVRGCELRIGFPNREVLPSFRVCVIASKSVESC